MPWTLAFALVVFPILAAIHYYVWRKLFPALCDLTAWDRMRLRIVTVGLHVWLSLLPLAYIVSYVVIGRRAIPAFAGDSLVIDLLFSYPFWIALVILFQLFVLFVLLDILEIVVFRFIPVTREWIRRHRSLIHVALTIVITLYSAVTIVVDTWTVRVVEHNVTLPPQFRSLHGFRIAQISDVQEDGRTTAKILRQYVAKVNSLRPDMIVFAGDLVTSGTRYINSAAETMGGLRSRFGTIAALGDHEFFTDKTMAVDAMERNGIKLIEDSTIVLDIDGTQVAISVVTSTYRQSPTTPKLHNLAEVTGNPYKIVLVHQPDEKLVQFARQNGYNLFLAGHTHGGGLAFGVPGLFLFAPASFETNYMSGLFRIDQLVISVTNGLGFTLAPIRFHAPAEISVIDLQ